MSQYLHNTKKISIATHWCEDTKLLQRVGAECEIPCNELEFLMTMEATLKANNNEDDIATSGVESDTDSVTLEESEKLFPDQEDELDKKEEALVLK